MHGSCCAVAARRDWSIVVTGHSLGAGAAALVALYIRSFYPNSRAWAFEPPGKYPTFSPSISRSQSWNNIIFDPSLACALSNVPPVCKRCTKRDTSGCCLMTTAIVGSCSLTRTRTSSEGCAWIA